MYWSEYGLTRNLPARAGNPSASVQTACTRAAHPRAKRGAGGGDAADAGPVGTAASGLRVMTRGNGSAPAQGVGGQVAEPGKDFENREPEARGERDDAGRPRLRQSEAA